MAQTSSATREPSMEEILASIRRIIEDSDVTKQATADLTSAPAAKAQPENRAETVKTSEPPAEEKRGEVAQFPRAVSSETVQANNHAVSPETTQTTTLFRQKPQLLKLSLRLHSRWMRSCVAAFRNRHHQHKSRN